MKTKNIIRNNMGKRLACIAVLLLCILYVNAQRKGYLTYNSTLSAVKEYFTNNISLLDDIEGIYDVSMTPHFSGGNLLYGLRSWGGHEYSTMAYIWKQSNGSVSLRFFDTKGVSISQSMNLTQLGSTNAYRLTGEYSEKYSHFGNSGILSFDISTRVVYDRIGFSLSFSGNDEYHKVEMQMSFVKTYPDATTIKKHQEAAVPKEWTGSGFALLEGYVVTNYHVVENATIIKIQGINGDFTKKYNANVIATDKVNDLALLKIEGTVPTNIPYSVKTNTSDVGEDVWVLGYPLTSTMGDEIKLTTGVVSAKSGFEGDVSLYQISAPIQPGNSGGPVFDGKGNLIGVVCAHHRGAENVSYAIKASYLRNLIESSINHNILPKTNRISAQNLANKVKSVKNYVYYITCTSKSNEMSFNEHSNSTHTMYNSNSSIFKVSYNKSNSCDLIINKVEICNNYTALFCQYTNTEYDLGGWYSMDAGAYIRDKRTGEKFVITKTDNCEITPRKTSIKKNETKQFVLYFPSIPTTVDEIDFVESNNSSWNISGIKLIKE